MPHRPYYEVQIKDIEARATDGVLEIATVVRLLSKTLRDQFEGDPQIIANFNDLVELNAQVDAAVNRLRPQEKPIEQMTYDEIVNELKARSVDPARIGYGSGADANRRVDLFNWFKRNGKSYRYAGAVDHKTGLPLTLDEKFRRHYLRMDYLLSMLRGTTDTGVGYATVPREKLFVEDGGVLATYMMDREDVLLLSYNPDWGQKLRDALKLTIKVAARADNLIPGTSNKTGYRLPSGRIFNYRNLSSAAGAEVLNEFFSTATFPEIVGLPAEAKKFAELLFVDLDMLSIVLSGKQRVANGTRNHNTFEKIEPTNFDPFVGFPQNGIRYPNKRDWRGNIWALAKRVPTPQVSNVPAYGLLHDEPGYGSTEIKNVSGVDREVFETEKLSKARELALAYWDCFFDLTLLEQFQIEPPGIGESIFPSTYDLLELGPTEVLDVMGEKKINRSGLVPINSQADIKPWPSYQVAYEAWDEMMIDFYSSPGDHLTEGDILSSTGEGKSGGLLSKFIRQAGRAKPSHMDDHMTKLYPGMLFLQAAKMIFASNIDLPGRIKLRDQICHDILSSPGINQYYNQLTKVVQALEDDRFISSSRNGWQSRPRQVDRYITLFCEYNSIEKPHINTRRLRNETWTPVQEQLAKVLKGEMAPPPPFLAQGSLLTKGAG